MVSLRSATSPPSSVRSSSRTNTPELDDTIKRPIRTYGTADSRRKSSRLSTSSVNAIGSVEKPLSNGSAKSDRRTSLQSGPTSDSESTHGPFKMDEEKEEEPVSVETLPKNENETSTDATAISATAEGSPVSEEAEVASTTSEQGSKTADALALEEAEKYMAKTSKRRRTGQPVIDASSAEEDAEEDFVQEREESENGMDIEVAKEAVEEVIEKKKKAAPAKKASPPAKKAQSKKIAPQPSPPLPAPTPTQSDVKQVNKLIPRPAPAKTSRPPVSTESIEASSSRKRKASPAIAKPVKRQKATTESQLKKSQAAEDRPTQLYCFQIIVFGDANASIKVRVPARLQTPRNLLVPDYVSIYPYNVVRCTTSDPTKPKSTYTSYRFPLPDRRHHESFDKVKIKIYGKTVKSPSARDGFILKDVETGKSTWTLEADEDRCRWTRD